MRNKTLLIAVLMALAVFMMSSAPALAQVVYGQPGSLGSSGTYTHWKLKSDLVDSTVTISQFMVPLVGFVPLQDNFDFTFYMANSSNSLSALDHELTLNGFSDIRLQANHSFANDRLLLGLGLNLPTGKRKLDLLEEEVVLFALSTNFLEFPMRRFGEGFGFNLLLGGATVLGEGIRGGAGLSYQFVGGYKPYADYGDYNPGDAIGLNAGIDAQQGEMLWRADFIYTLFTADKLGGVNVFKQSPQLDMHLSGTHATKVTSFGGFLRYVVRGDNKTYDAAGAELIPFKLYGNEFSLGTGLTRKFTGGWSASPSIAFRSISSSDLGLDNSSLWDFGTSFGKELGENFTADAGFRFYTGSAAHGFIDVTGYQLTLGLTASM